MVKYRTGSLDKIFSALSDPTRRAILDRLTKAEASVTELAAPFDMSLPAVSKHLRILEEAGLVIRKKSGRIHHFQIAALPMQNAFEWLERYKIFWEAQFDSLEDYLSSKNKTGEEK